MKFLVLLLFLISTISSQAIGQISLSGRILDAANDSHIPYANIGIKNAEVGTISNKDDTFAINITGKYNNEELLFSSVGFCRIGIIISAITEIIASVNGRDPPEFSQLK